MSVFSDAWRDCLREHYKSVIRNNDKVTLRSLLGVMNEVGFGEDELRALELEATMRVEDVAEDFVPNLNILQPEEEIFQPHPLECQCPACVEINLQPHDEEGQPAEIDPEEIIYQQKKANSPQQLTLF